MKLVKHNIERAHQKKLLIKICWTTSDSTTANKRTNNFSNYCCKNCTAIQNSINKGIICQNNTIVALISTGNLSEFWYIEIYKTLIYYKKYSIWNTHKFDVGYLDYWISD